MNDIKSVIDLAIDLRELPEAAFILAFLCIFSGACVAFDVYSTYTTLLPWETLWSSLSMLDQIRVVFMAGMFVLSAWYGTGALKRREAVLGHGN